MKNKILFLLSALLLTSMSYSQINITFTVDVTGFPVYSGGMHIAGEFVTDSSLSIHEQWQPHADGSQMTLLFGDTYGANVTFPENSAGLSLQFEFVRDSAWWNSYGDPSEGNGNDTSVFFDESCSVNDYVGGLNRIITIPDCGGNYDCQWNKCGYVIPDPCDTPGFACNNQSVCEKFCINFFDSTNTNAITWQWIFAGGTPSSSSLQNPDNICYENPGVYDVTLITTSASGIDTFYKPNYITVNTTPPFPTITQSGYTLTSSVADFYQWQFNTVNIPGATDQSYSVMQSGYYTVVIADSAGCVNSTTDYVLISGIDQVSDNSSLSIFPNPFSFSTSISFSLPQPENVSLKIFDQQGRLIHKFMNDVLGTGTHTLIWDATDENGNAMSAGMYFFQFQSADIARTEKLIIR